MNGFYFCNKHGFVQKGDSITADEGFTIKGELSKSGLCLNISPLSTCSAQITIRYIFDSENCQAYGES